MTGELTLKDEVTDFLLYNSPDGKIKVDVFLHNEDVWLSQKNMSELFGVQRPAITKHLKNIFECGELDENSVSSILEHTASDGKIYKISQVCSKLVNTWFASSEHLSI